jgi:hypothetical protein
VTTSNPVNEEHGTNRASNLNSAINAGSQKRNGLRSSGSGEVGGEVVSDTGGTAHLLKEDESPGTPQTRPQGLVLEEDEGRGDGVLLVPENVGVALVELLLDFGELGCATELHEGLAGFFDAVLLEEPARASIHVSAEDHQAVPGSNLPFGHEGSTDAEEESRNELHGDRESPLEIEALGGAPVRIAIADPESKGDTGGRQFV